MRTDLFRDASTWRASNRCMTTHEKRFQFANQFAKIAQLEVSPSEFGMPQP